MNLLCAFEKLMCYSWESTQQQQRVNRSNSAALLLASVRQPRNCRSPDSDDRIKERLVSRHYTLIYPLSNTQTHTHRSPVSPWRPIRGQARSRWRQRGGWIGARSGSARGTPGPAGWLWTPAAGESSGLPERENKRQHKFTREMFSLIWHHHGNMISRGGYVNFHLQQQTEVCLTHIRGLLGGRGRYEELSLTGESLLHHVCLVGQQRQRHFH